MPKLIGLMHIVCLLFYLTSISDVIKYIRHKEKPSDYNDVMHLFRLSFYENILVYYPLMFLFVVGYPLYIFKTMDLPFTDITDIIAAVFVILGAVCTATCIRILKINNVR